ncbi:MAG: hypothetical protein ACT4QE_23540 [Anaerolineales bacterium]
MKRLLISLSLLALLAAACAPMVVPGQPQPATSTPVPPTATPIPSPTPEFTPAQRGAMKALAELLGISMDQIKVIRTEAAQWDGCYGIGYPFVACAKMLIQGYKIVLEANGHQYQFHANEDGSSAFWAAWEVPSPEGAAVKALVDKLGVTVPEIKLVTVEAAEWPDSCLGVSRPEARCAQVITPGYRVVLDYGGQAFTFHTNADGSAVIEALATLSWNRQGGIAGFCDSLRVATDGQAASATCNQTEAQAELTEAEVAQLIEWAEKFTAVVIEQADPEGVSDRMVITLQMTGLGNEQPTDAEQQAILEWAQAVYTRLTTQ